ncbi:GNAT family N-acetyltransferase [uncultured Tateyamaria sp.]|uniref:GNAT family N-acetyltransferase n=1 Tax=Tateyamaria sp. 1078 TaxID=3417464 RepID=UPI00261B1425|nr:GNAT family N-acetyltransferase [uncultured Tateyamaria sp.]
MTLTIRAATVADAKAMSRILRDVLVSWNSPRPFAPDHVTAHYITHPDGLRCSVAVDAAGDILGFQSLKRATEGNPFDLPDGYGIIGSYVDASATGQGVGRALFAASLAAAQAAGLAKIDATIADSNAAGLAYYAAMGFRTYRQLPGAIGKVYVLDPPAA